MVTKKIRKLNSEELSDFCLKYYMMVKAGISIEDGASLMLEDSSSPEDGAVLTQVVGVIQSGKPLASALEQTGCFPEQMVKMIGIGETTGRIEAVLYSLSQYYKREASLKTAIKSAVTYPVTMLVVVCVILIVLIWQVLPVFAGVYGELGADLPAVAKALIGLGDVSKYVALVFAAFILVLTATVLIAASGSGSRQKLMLFADKLFFRGRLDATVKRSRFASVMALMVSGGLSMDESLDRAELLLGNTMLSAAVAQCREFMANGLSFSQAAKESGVFDGVPAGILAAGFRSGDIEGSMNELAAKYEDEANAMLGRVLSRIEPALIIVLALAVALVLLSVMLPLLGMMNSIGA